MSIKQWFLLSATLAFPLSAQTAAGSGEESLVPVSVEVFQSRVEQQGSQNEVSESFTWWVTVDEVEKTATIVAPPTDGKYQFEFAGWQSVNAIAEYGMYLWNPAIAGLPGESLYFSAVRLPEKVTIDDTDYTVTAIGNRAFAESNVAYLHVPSSVTSIGDYAFENATSLVGINVASGYELVPNSVTELGRGAFKGCTALKRIDIGNGVAELKEETFDGCTSLTQISLGSAVAKISCKLSGEIAFH